MFESNQCKPSLKYFLWGVYNKDKTPIEGGGWSVTLDLPAYILGIKLSVYIDGCDMVPQINQHFQQLSSNLCGNRKMYMIHIVFNKGVIIIKEFLYTFHDIICAQGTAFHKWLACRNIKHDIHTKHFNVFLQFARTI